MQAKRKSHKVIQLVIVLISVAFLASEVPAELTLEAVYPTLGLLEQDLESVVLIGKEFDANTRVSMSLDVYNKKAIINSMDTPGSAYRITTAGDYAYVADGSTGLQIVDISNPKNPKIISSVYTQGYYAYSADNVTISGNYAYVAFTVTEEFCEPPPNDFICEYYSSGGLQMIDISNPLNPYVVGSIFLSYEYSPCDISISGNYAYVTAPDEFKVVDISNPSNPNVIGSLNAPCGNLSVSGDYAYIADYSGLVVIDISTPTTPQLIGTGVAIDTADVVVSGDYAYITESFNGSLHIVNVSDPQNLSIEGSAKTAYYSGAIALLGGYAYITTDRGIQVFDISTTSNPQLVGSVTCDSRDIALAGGYAYVTSSDGIQVISIDTASNLWIIGWEDTPGWAEDVVVSGNYAYVVDQDGLQVIDISTPASPEIIGSVPTSGWSYDIEVIGDYAYVANGSLPGSGLSIINISNPSSPGEVGWVPTDCAFGLTVSGNYAYVADGPSGFKVIDISNPQNPWIVSSIPTPDWAFRVAVSGNYAFVTCNSKGLQVIDINNPSNPHIIGKSENIGYPRGIAVVNDYAYVGGHVINISDPAAPLDLGFLWGSGGDHLTVVGNYLYSAGGGVDIVDITNPTNPTAISSIGSLSDASSVAASGDYLYLADKTCGLLVLPAPVEITPVTVNSETNISLTIPSPIISGHYTLQVFNEDESDYLFSAISFTTDLTMLNTKAIIVAGGGPNAPGEIWEETKQSANKAYDVLVHEGFDHDNIWYLTDEYSNPFRRGSSRRPELEWAIKTWAKDASELSIFFVDHGLPDNFIIYASGEESEQLSVDDLDDWLDNLQQTIVGPVTFIYDACNSGTFATKLSPPIGKDRIVITGASDEPAYFRGEDSFSFQFWEQILLKEGNLGHAFSEASDLMQGYQSALINCNGNANTNEEEDYTIANGVIIRRAKQIYLKQAPTIGNVSDVVTLNGQSSAAIWVSDVREAESVWAKIIPPDINPEEDGVPITDLDSIELQDTDYDGTYDGTYDGFTTEGTYIIVINAQTSQEIYSYVQGTKTNWIISSLPVYTSVTQMNGTHDISADSYEEDDTYHQANVITINNLDVQPHNFHDVGDEDWVKFYGLSVETYKIKASNLSIICDAVIEVFDSDGTTRLVDPINVGGAGEDEFLEWLCPQDGIYYVKIRNFNTNFGENTKYDLKVYIPIGPITGWIKGTIKNKCTGESIVEALIKTNNGSSAISLPNGAYLIIHEAGTFTVTAEASGYTPVSYPDIEVSEAGTTIQDFEMASLDDSDGDSYPDGCDAFPNDPNEWLDTDSDGTGNNADPDDDNDDMPDTWEIQYGLDPLDESDASEDPDQDGYTNVEEYTLGRHPNNAEPDTPALSSPIDNAINVSLTPELQTEAFSDPDSGDTHAETTWQISTQSNFSSLVLDIPSDSFLTSLTVPEFIVTVNTTYYWRVKFSDNRGAASEWSDPYYSFTTIDASASDDTDSNGIPDDQEVDNTVDLDGDGEPDYNQSDMKSVNTVVGDGQIGIKEGTNITSIDSIKSINPDTISDTTNKPDEMPLGIITFKVTVDNPGDTAEVVVYLSEPVPIGAKWYKYDTIHGWREYLYATFSTDRTYVTLALKDGDWEHGDMDGTENRIIVDPSGFAAVSTPSPPPPSGGGGGGGGCFIATAAYGSYMEQHVKILREFRDRFMLTNYVGKAFIDLYHTYSPPVGDFIANHDIVRLMIRWSLLPLVGVSWVAVHFGLWFTLVILLLIFALMWGATVITIRWMKFRH